MEITTRSLAAVLLAVALLTMLSRADAPPAADPFVKKDAPPPVPASGPIGNLLFTVEIYTTSQADGAAILQDESSDQARYQRVLDLAKAGKATFDNLIAATCISGEQAVAESVDIMRYPISFFLNTKTPEVANSKARNLGCRLVYKAQSVLNNEATDLVVFLEGCSLHSILAQPLSSGGTLPRPQFDAQRMNLKVVIPDGSFRFLGTMSPEPQDTFTDSKMTLVFGKMEFVQLKSDDGAKPGGGMLENQFSLYSMDRDKAAEILRQNETPGSVFASVKALVGRNEAKLEHVSVLRGTGIKENLDEVYEFMYPINFDRDDSVSQDVGFSAEAATKFIGNTSLVTVDLTKLQLLKNRGQLHGQTVAPGYDASPLFELQSAVTSVNAPLGENEFVGTISPPGDVGLLGLKPTGQVWLAFVKTTVANP